MATRGLLALLDDVFAMTRLATRRVSGVVGDDLALTAKTLNGVSPDRVGPMIKDIALGSLKNKAIIVPCALVLATIAPWLITPLMMAGGAYLCYEGIEKMMHGKKGEQAPVKALTAEEAIAFEKDKVSSAIRTDVILSSEIAVMTLAAMGAAPLVTQALVLGGVGILMTGVVYGAVAGILNADKAGLKMMEAEGDDFGSKCKRTFGKALVHGMPHVMKAISWLGTAAVFAVGGEILLHSLPWIGPAVEGLGFLAQNAVTIGTGLAAGFGIAKTMEVPFVQECVSKVKTGFDKVCNFFGIKRKTVMPEPESPSITYETKSPLAGVKSPKAAVNGMGMPAPKVASPVPKPDSGAKPGLS